MDGFFGRKKELSSLSQQLRKATEGGRAGRPGRAVLMRGRRRVGKSRLAERFIELSKVPYVFFTASKQPSVAQDLSLFAKAVVNSDLPGASLWREHIPQSWDAALELLAASIPQDQPSIVVLDEMPYLIENDSGFEGTLQKMFDRELSKRPVLLLCVGSDLAMMEALNEYGRPFHQRATEMIISPLNPANVADMLKLPPPDAFDAYLVTGGLPLILDEWPSGTSVMEFLLGAAPDPTSALYVSGERALAAEFPPDAYARVVLNAIGAGERTFTHIRQSVGEMPQTTLARALQLLLHKKIIEAARPLSVRRSREIRYSVADPHLRFWVPFLGPYLPEIERGRADLTVARIRKSWTTWRGKAIEPIIRESLRRMTDDTLPSETNAVGGYWTRINDPEIDVVGADTEPVANKITVVGSIKWLENRQFDGRDLSRLLVHRSQLPGASDDTPLVAVSRAGSRLTEGIRVLTPADLLTAWEG